MIFSCGWSQLNGFRDWIWSCDVSHSTSCLLTSTRTSQVGRDCFHGVKNGNRSSRDFCWRCLLRGIFPNLLFLALKLYINWNKAQWDLNQRHISPIFCQKVDTHQILSKNWKISVPLSAANFLLCYTSQFFIKIRYTGPLNMGGLLNDLSQCPHRAAAEWFPQTLNWSLNGLLCTPKWAGRWVGRLWVPELSCMIWDDHTGIPFQQCQSWLDEGKQHGADETLCAVWQSMLREEKHVKLGLLEDESVPALGFFFC